MSVAIVDAGPLIFLARLNRLDLLKMTAEHVFVPTAVLEEIRSKPDPTLSMINGVLGNWLSECKLNNPGLMKLLLGLGAGEREVLMQAFEQHASIVIIDDQDARRVTRRLGLKLIGTIGLLLVGKKRGIVSSVRAEIEQLEASGFWISKSLRLEALKEAGENEYS